ncbi:MAG: hypothetical protein KJN97_10180 [Deltaproteobacteria bacterium]|nr:hypothetical protein [Deltaproteobacteria bacterium]
MRAAVLTALVFTLLLGSAIGAARGTSTSRQSVDGRPYVRGVALGMFATDPGWDYGPLIEEIRARGATDVLVVVNAYQSDRFASDIAPRPGHSPSEVTVARTLAQVRRAGMRAALMPVVRLRRRTSHEWRGVIAPADGLDAWFDAYRRFVVPLARLGQDAGAQRFVVGSELGSLEPYQDHWRALISELRDEFSGVLSYSANWDHAQAVLFWDALDEVGLTAYFPLAASDEPSSAESLARAWRAPRAAIEDLRQRIGKPVLITEIGYPSQRNAAGRPWDDTSSAELDLRLQQRLYRSFCDAFSQTPSISGFYVWNWFGFGGPRDLSFTPRGKPAANELAKCFERTWPTSAPAKNPS